jgi:hypothetical protein
LKADDPELFDREFRKQLESLDAEQVAGDCRYVINLKFGGIPLAGELA